jgi:hypothetical protein
MNRNPYTGQPVVNPQGTPRHQAVDLLEHFGGLINPVGTAVGTLTRGLVPGLGGQLGLRQQYKGPPARIIKQQKRSAIRQESKDPLQRGTKALLGP